MSKPKLTPDQVREIQGLLKNGKLTQREIGERYNVAGSSISAIRAGRRTDHNFSSWTPENEALLGTMYDSALADILGITTAAVYQKRKWHGIKAYSKRNK